MKLLALSLFAAALLLPSNGEEGVRSFDGHQVFRVKAKSMEQLEILREFYFTQGPNDLDFWSNPGLNSNTDIMVGPKGKDRFLKKLDLNFIQHEVFIEDVQRLINEEKATNERAKARHTQGGITEISWDRYVRFDEIEEFVNEIPARSNIATVTTFGQSHEGRNLYAVKISTSANNTKSIVIDAGFHSREWITAASTTWLINELATNATRYSRVLDGIDFYLLPHVNPDGYEYTHTDDRMWRKTRGVNAGSTCRGADPNRNFPFHFGGASTSPNPCDYQLYHGDAPLSEKETKALADFILDLQNKTNLMGYISYHSYSQLWLLPWANARGSYPEDWEEQLSLGNDIARAIATHAGTQYEVGTAGDILYAVGGCSYDWGKSIGIKYSVSPEMRDTGRYGFLLPADQIIDNSIEMMLALEVFAERVRSH